MPRPSYTSDTSKEAREIQLQQMRAMTPRQRLELSIELSENVRTMCFNAIRRRHPKFSEEEVNLKFIELNYGKKLAEEVREHLRQRAGA